MILYELLKKENSGVCVVTEINESREVTQATGYRLGSIPNAIHKFKN